MNKFKSTLDALKMVIKYASYIYVIVDILTYAHERINTEIEKETPKDKINA